MLNVIGMVNGIVDIKAIRVCYSIWKGKTFAYIECMKEVNKIRAHLFIKRLKKVLLFKSLLHY